LNNEKQKTAKRQGRKEFNINFFATFRLCGFLKEDIRNEIKKEIQI
jgi:hypothetical protein